MPLRLTVLGGSSPFTAALIDALRDVASNLPAIELVLQGRSEQNLAVVHNYATRQLAPLSWKCTFTTELECAVDGASIVLHQIRYGGLEIRAAGEDLCRQCGVAADETLGPAALLSALELPQHIEPLCQTLAHRCPDAWVLNLTNPLSCVTALMSELGLKHIVGLCELPRVTAGQVAEVCEVDVEQVAWQYCGLNHRGFIVRMETDGRDLIAELPRQLGKGAIAGIPAAQIAELQAVPLKYFRLLTGETPPAPGRAAVLRELRSEILQQLTDAPDESPAALKQRYLEWYPQSVVPLIAALHQRVATRHVVNLPCPDGLVRELLAEVDCRGIRPQTVGPAPSPVREWLDRFERHEVAFCRAVHQPSHNTIRAALEADPIVPALKLRGVHDALTAFQSPCTRFIHDPCATHVLGLSKRKRSMLSIRVAVVGCGRMGRQRALAADAWGAEVVAVCDAHRPTAEALAADLPSAACLGDADELPWKDLDAVFVCTPPDQRGPVELRAIAEGLAVFIEKPVGCSAAQFRPVVDAATGHGIVNAVGYMNRYRPSVQAARARLAGGDILGVSAHWLGGRYKVAWWGQDRQSGGPVNEQATHLADLARYLCGEPIEVQGQPQWEESHQHTIVSRLKAAAFTLRFESGAVGTLLYSCAAAEKFIGMRICTPTESVLLDGWDFRLRDGEMLSPADADRNAVFQVETAAFLFAVQTGDSRRILSDFSDALQTQQVVDAMTRSLQTGRIESVDESSETSHHAQAA